MPTASAAVFTLGYLLVWAFYATIAAATQWELHRLALLSSAMAAASPLLGGGLLLLAGIYQWLPLKGACLSHCRSPLGFCRNSTTRRRTRRSICQPRFA